MINLTAISTFNATVSSSVLARSPKMFLEKGDDRIGHVYKKTIYFEYTDATFTVEIPKHPTLGLLGPLLHAEVGDRLEITYFNNASRKFSVHPHGLFYNKDGEGRYRNPPVTQYKKVESPVFNVVYYKWNS